MNNIKNLTTEQLEVRIQSCDDQLLPLIIKRRTQRLNLAEIDTIADTSAEQRLYYAELRTRNS